MWKESCWYWIWWKWACQVAPNGWLAIWGMKGKSGYVGHSKSIGLGEPFYIRKRLYILNYKKSDILFLLNIFNSFFFFSPLLAFCVFSHQPSKIILRISPLPLRSRAGQTPKYRNNKTRISRSFIRMHFRSTECDVPNGIPTAFFFLVLHQYPQNHGLLSFLGFPHRYA